MRSSATWRRLAATLALVVLTTAGCAGSDSVDDSAPESTQPAQTPPTTIAEAATVRDAIDEGAKVIDVRTPEEFATGHVRGAVNIDASDPAFVEHLAALDETARYVVYCASGNRAGQAIVTMSSHGFGDLVNGGSYEDLAALGVPTS